MAKFKKFKVKPTVDTVVDHPIVDVVPTLPAAAPIPVTPPTILPISPIENFQASINITSLDWAGPPLNPFVDASGVTHVSVKSGGALYVDRDWSSFMINFNVADPDGLINAGQVALRITSGDGEVLQYNMQQTPFGYVSNTGQEIANQGVPSPQDPSNFIWTSNAGTIADTDGYNDTFTSGYTNIGDGGQYVFGSDYRNAGEHYDVEILLNGVTAAHTIVDLI